MLLSARSMTGALRCMLSLGILTFFTLGAHAQNLNKGMCRQFREAGTLYVLGDENDQSTFPNMEGQPRTFVQLVKEVWPEKNIIIMNKDRYEAQEDVKQLFFVGLIDFTSSIEQSMVSTLSSTFSMLLLKKGKLKYDPDHTVYASFIDGSDIASGVAAARFVTALQEMRMQTDHPEEGDHDRGSYQASDLATMLRTDTLYVENTQVYIKSLNGATPQERDLGDVYPYPLRLVSPEEWAEVINERRKGVAYLEYIPGGNGAVETIHEASNGRLLLFSMRMVLNKKFFAKLAHA